MTNDLVTVIMPAFNAGQYISDAIESVSNQTHQNWELIIIDDGSSDDTLAIARGFERKDSRIRCISDANAGAGAARNTGLKISRGEWMAFLDADDLWVPEKLSFQLDLIRETNAQVVFNAAWKFTGKPAANSPISVTDGYCRGAKAVKDFVQANPVPLLTAFVNVGAMQRANGFSENKRLHEDYDLWLRMLIQGETFYGSNEPLAYYRIHEMAQTSSDATLLQKDLATLEQLGKGFPQYSDLAGRSGVHKIDLFLANNRCPDRSFALSLLEARNRITIEKFSTRVWSNIYSFFGGKIFRLLIRFKLGRLAQSGY